MCTPQPLLARASSKILFGANRCAKDLHQPLVSIGIAVGRWVQHRPGCSITYQGSFATSPACLDLLLDPRRATYLLRRADHVWTRRSATEAITSAMVLSTRLFRRLPAQWNEIPVVKTQKSLLRCHQLPLRLSLTAPSTLMFWLSFALNIVPPVE